MGDYSHSRQAYSRLTTLGQLRPRGKPVTQVDPLTLLNSLTLAERRCCSIGERH